MKLIYLLIFLLTPFLNYASLEDEENLFNQLNRRIPNIGIEFLTHNQTKLAMENFELSTLNNLPNELIKHIFEVMIENADLSDVAHFGQTCRYLQIQFLDFLTNTTNLVITYPLSWAPIDDNGSSRHLPKKFDEAFKKLKKL